MLYIEKAQNYFKKLNIHLIDINKEMTDAWEVFFSDIINVKIHNSDLHSFLNNYKIEAIVSPANSFGIMTGGYDKAIINYFGKDLMDDVQNIIKFECLGEQPVGTSITVPIRNVTICDENNNEKYAILIHTPTMRRPEQIIDSRIIYQCMRTTLIEAMNQEVKSILIPAFGGCTGKVDKKEIAYMMRMGYDQLINIPNEITWNSIMKIEK